MKTLEDIYAAHPELEEIAMRLEDSEKEANSKNKQRKTSGNSENTELHMSSDKKKRTLSINAEVARISDYYKDKRWNATSYISKPGRKEFENSLMRVVETRNPDAIKVKVFPSQRELTCRLEKTIWLNQEAFSDTADKQPTSPVAGLGAIETAIEQLKSQFLETAKNSTPTTDWNTQQQIMQLQHADMLKDIKHEREIDNIKRDFEDKIRQYQQELETKEEEIEALEEELADVEDSLDGLDEKIEAAKNPSWVDLAGKALGRGLEAFAKDNTKLIGNALGMTETELASYWKEKEGATKQIPTNTTQASYSTAENTEHTDILSHLSPEKRRYAESLLAMVDAMSIENLKILVTLLQQATNEDGTINTAKADVMLKCALDLEKNDEEIV
jgi:hypothetical protein